LGFSSYSPERPAQWAAGRSKAQTSPLEQYVLYINFSFGNKNYQLKKKSGFGNFFSCFWMKPYVHQACIYVITNTVKLWNNIKIQNSFSIFIFFLNAITVIAKLISPHCLLVLGWKQPKLLLSFSARQSLTVVNSSYKCIFEFEHASCMNCRPEQHVHS